MNPSANIESIKSEYFDAEYTRMSPRLSLYEEAANNESSFIRGKAARSKSMKIVPSNSSFDDHYVIAINY